MLLLQNTKVVSFGLIIFILVGCSHQSKETTLKKKKYSNEYCVCLQPLGNFDDFYIQNIRNAIEKQYQFQTQILPQKNIPSQSYTLNIKELKKYNPQPYPRYRADTLIDYLKKTKPEKCDFILGLTSQDISTTNRINKNKIKEPEYLHCDWGIFGLGFLGGNSCIISSFRLSFGTLDKNIISKRVRKTAVHEIGHNLGLDHCKTPLCNMNAAPSDNALLANDTKNEHACQKCLEFIDKKFPKNIKK